MAYKFAFANRLRLRFTGGGIFVLPGCVTSLSIRSALTTGVRAIDIIKTTAPIIIAVVNNAAIHVMTPFRRCDSSKKIGFNCLLSLSTMTPGFQLAVGV
jgi:hypothetical protein